MPPDLDMFADDAAKHFHEIGGGLVQAQRLRPHDLAAAEQEKLGDQPGGAVTGRGDLLLEIARLLR